MSQTIALVTCLRWPELSVSDQLYADALRSRGYTVQVAPWNGPGDAFAGADLVVLRSNWDYHYAADAFRTWLNRLTATGTRVLNPPDLVLWNVDKQYLLDLEHWGIAIPATRIVPPAADAVRAAIAEVGGGPAVLKPAYGASGHLVRLATPDAVDEVVALFLADAQRRDVIVQEFLPELPRQGELSCVFFDGVYSHAALKQPVAGEYRINAQFGGTFDRTDLPAKMVDQAGAALSCLPQLPLYARVDGVVRDGRFVLLELELNEPGLYLQLDPEAPKRFAEATARRLEATAIRSNTAPIP